MIDYVAQIKGEIEAVRRAHKGAISSLYRTKYATELHLLEFLVLPQIEALQAERDYLLADKRANLEAGANFQYRLENLVGNLSEHVEYGYVEYIDGKAQRTALGEEVLKRIQA